MKMRKKMLWLLPAACCAAFLLYVVLTRGMADHQPPEITVPEGTLEISVYAREEELLSGVTAEDKRDGNVTDEIVVEDISDIHDGNRATITYAAFDRSGNVSKAQRDVIYTDYTGPRFTLSEPLIFREGSRIAVFDPLGAEDSFDGDLTDRIKGTLVSDQPVVSRAGAYQVEFRVTNTLGDTEKLTLPVEVIASSSTRRRLELTDYLIYLEQDSSFDPGAYVTGSSRDALSGIRSHVDTSMPGVYTVDYLDRSGSAYAATRLIVVVEEGSHGAGT